MSRGSLAEVREVEHDDEIAFTLMLLDEVYRGEIPDIDDGNPTPEWQETYADGWMNALLYFKHEFLNRLKDHEYYAGRHVLELVKRNHELRIELAKLKHPVPIPTQEEINERVQAVR